MAILELVTVGSYSHLDIQCHIIHLLFVKIKDEQGGSKINSAALAEPKPFARNLLKLIVSNLSPLSSLLSEKFIKKIL